MLRSLSGSALPSDGVTASVDRTTRKRGKNSYTLRHVSSNRLRRLSRFFLRESIQCQLLQPTFPLTSASPTQISHSCNPSARPSFSSGTSELHLIATRPLKKGDEVTVAYVDVTQPEPESILDARRRRRTELARGWRFACGCKRCAEEGVDASDVDGAPQTDESKTDAAVSRIENTDVAA